MSGENYSPESGEESDEESVGVGRESVRVVEVFSNDSTDSDRLSSTLASTLTSTLILGVRGLADLESGES